MNVSFIANVATLNLLIASGPYGTIPLTDLTLL